MELKLVVAIEVENNGNKFTFLMPNGAAFGSCYDAAFKVLDKIKELAHEATEKARPSSANEENPDKN